MARDEVLVVDDDEALRAVVAEALQSEGFAVQTAASAVEALEHMRDHRPSLVLLDLMMPGMSGWQMLDAMQESHALRDVPVVVLTAFDVRYDLPPGRPVLHKPVEPGLLVMVVRSVLHPGADAARKNLDRP
jgi:CheY-like chemotaxis protein